MKRTRASRMRICNLLFSILLLLVCDATKGESTQSQEIGHKNFDQDLDLALSKNSSLLPFIQELHERESPTSDLHQLRPQPDLKKALIERELRVRPEEQKNLSKLLETQSERRNLTNRGNSGLPEEMGKKWNSKEAAQHHSGWTRNQWTAVLWSSLILGIAASHSPYRVIVRLP